jgi:hypothetical protein
MTIKETMGLLSLIQVYYPRFVEGRDVSQTAKAWQLLFADDDYQLVQAALIAYVATDTKGFPPMPGALKDQMAKKVTRMTEMEAWNLIRQAISNSAYHSEEEFAKLPPECQRLVGSPGRLYDWAVSDADDVDTVIASNIQRSYRTLVEHDDYVAKIPQATLHALPGFDQMMLMPGAEA